MFLLLGIYFSCFSHAFGYVYITTFANHISFKTYLCNSRISINFQHWLSKTSISLILKRSVSEYELYLLMRIGIGSLMCFPGAISFFVIYLSIIIATHFTEQDEGVYSFHFTTINAKNGSHAHLKDDLDGPNANLFEQFFASINPIKVSELYSSTFLGQISQILAVSGAFNCPFLAYRIRLNRIHLNISSRR